MNGWSAWVAVGAVCATLGIGTCSTNSRIGTLETQLGKRIETLETHLGKRLDTLEQDVRRLADSVQALLIQTAAGESKGDAS